MKNSFLLPNGRLNRLDFIVYALCIGIFFGLLKLFASAELSATTHKIIDQISLIVLFYFNFTLQTNRLHDINVKTIYSVIITLVSSAIYFLILNPDTSSILPHDFSVSNPLIRGAISIYYLAIGAILILTPSYPHTNKWGPRYTSRPRFVHDHTSSEAS